MKASSDAVENRFCYSVGAHTLLLESAVRAEVLTNQQHYPLPFAPQWCDGLISLRGDLFPVINMHRVLQGQTYQGKPQLLLIQHPQFPPIALTCDGYPKSLKLPAKALTPQTEDPLPSWIPHTLHHQGIRLLAADHGKLLRYLQRTQGS